MKERGDRMPLVLLVGSVVVGVLGYAFPLDTWLVWLGRDKSIAATLAAEVPIVSAIIGFGCFLSLAITRSHRNLDHRITGISATLHATWLNQSQVTTCSVEDADNAIISILSSANPRVVGVRNTCHFLNEVEPIYPPFALRSRFLEVKASAIGAKTAWSDIVSPGYRPTCEVLNRLVRKTAQEGGYSHWVLPNEIPITNFIILQYVDNSLEVWWGWPFTKEHQMSSTKVARSRDRVVVEIFRTHWLALKEIAERSKHC